MRMTYELGEGGSTGWGAFQCELAVLRRLNSLGLWFAPRLMGCDDNELWIETERISGAGPLHARLPDLQSNQIENVVSDLITIDTHLYIQKIDYRPISADHILIDRDGRAHLTGFGRSHIDSELGDILFDSILDPIECGLVDSQPARAFFAMLSGRRDEVYRYLVRSVRRVLPEILPRRVGRWSVS